MQKNDNGIWKELYKLYVDDLRSDIYLLIEKIEEVDMFTADGETIKNEILDKLYGEL